MCVVASLLMYVWIHHYVTAIPLVWMFYGPERLWLLYQVNFLDSFMLFILYILTCIIYLFFPFLETPGNHFLSLFLTLVFLPLIYSYGLLLSFQVRV